MIFLKSVAGGLVAVIVTWLVIIYVFHWRINLISRQQGIKGFGAVAGSWEMLLHTWWIAALLALAFGIGLYWTAWRS